MEDLKLILLPSPKPNSKNGNFVGKLELALWYIGQRVPVELPLGAVARQPRLL